MPDSRLEVDDNETYVVEPDTTEQYTGATVNGSVDVDGSDSSLQLVDDAEIPGEGPFNESPSRIDLPMGPLNIHNMQLGTAWMLTGVMALLLGPVAVFRNYAAGLVWGMAFLALVFSGLFGIGLETFWALVVATVLTLVVGMVVSWMQ